MQTLSIRGSGEPVRVNASLNACEGLGLDPRKALGPAAIRAAQTGRTHDRTDQCCTYVKKVLANQAPSTHDPKQTFRWNIASVLSQTFESRDFANMILSRHDEEASRIPSPCEGSRRA